MALPEIFDYRPTLVCACWFPALWSSHVNLHRDVVARFRPAPEVLEHPDIMRSLEVLI